MFTSILLIKPRTEYNVVVLPEPVGPVTIIIPSGLRSIFLSSASLWLLKPRLSIGIKALRLSSKRITIFSP